MIKTFLRVVGHLMHSFEPHMTKMAFTNHVLLKLQLLTPLATNYNKINVDFKFNVFVTFLQYFIAHSIQANFLYCVVCVCSVTYIALKDQIR